MDIVVKGRNVDVPEHYREHVTEKLDKAVSKFDRKIIGIDVELLHEPNPRQHDHSQRVEITCFSRGPVVRAEAASRDFYTALDEAISRLNTRLRRAADRRRRIRKRDRIPAAAVAAPAGPAPVTAGTEPAERGGGLGVEAEAEDHQPYQIAREKEHPGEPITIEDALFQMELVGHDFYLFQDKESGRPSVVYRRRGYHYGVISLADRTA